MYFVKTKYKNKYNNEKITYHKIIEITNKLVLTFSENVG